MAAANPFRPGFAERPLVLAGRQEVLNAGDEAMTVAIVDGRTPMPVILVGPRGVGKTVVLDEISRRVGQRHGWPRVWVEASPSVRLAALIARESETVRRVVADADPGPRLKLSEAVLRAQVLGVGGEVHLTPRGIPAPGVQSSLGGLIDTLAGMDSGLVVVVDEAQAASQVDFAEFASTVQRAVGEALPLVTLVAGLPTLRRRTSDTDQSLGYLERADWHELAALTPEEAAQALEGPAAQAGRPMDPDATVILAAASGGYPYAVQVYGKHAWRVSTDAGRITVDHARAAAVDASRELDRNLYRARWDQTPRGEQTYLRALAELSVAAGPVTGRAVADRLGVTTRAVSPVRARLISRGTLIPQGDELSFMVPGMADWIRARTDANQAAQGGDGGRGAAPTEPAPGAGKSGDRQRDQAVRAAQHRRGRPGRDFGR